MEGRNYYAAQFSSKNAKSEQEMKTIAFCNAAAIGVAKTMNRFNPEYLSKEDFEDAMSDAILNALLHVNDSTTGLSYADKCGMSSAIKACKSVTRHNSRFSRIDRIDDDGDWYQDSQICTEESEDWADAGIAKAEEAREKELGANIVWECFKDLSAIDQLVVELKMQNTPYSEIASRVGCSEGAIQKRSSDIKKRFHASQERNGYFDIQ